MVIPKLAATIKVLREHPVHGLEVLLLRRNKKLKFAPSFWVFPGGKIDAIEISESADEMEAATTAAVREAKEESNLVISPDDLKYFVEWTTPENQPYRYQTYFFHAPVKFEESEVTIDDSEIKEHRWYSPIEALKAATKKEIIILPPTYISLLRIKNCKNYKEVIQEWERHDPHVILPKVDTHDGIMHCMYEGDCGYHDAKYNLPGARHRLIADYNKGEFTFQHSDCDDHFPISGGHHN